MHAPSYPAPPPAPSAHALPATPPLPSVHAPAYAQPAYPAYPQPLAMHPPPAYAPPVHAPPVHHAYGPLAPIRRREPAVAALLSFFVPGAGQLYNGDIGKALGFFFVSLFVNLPLMLVAIGFFTQIATSIWSIADAHASAERINRGGRAT
jgi:TM2 domain-containing membrane protein YozV